MPGSDIKRKMSCGALQRFIASNRQLRSGKAGTEKVVDGLRRNSQPLDHFPVAKQHTKVVLVFGGSEIQVRNAATPGQEGWVIDFVGERKNA